MGVKRKAIPAKHKKSIKLANKQFLAVSSSDDEQKYEGRNVQKNPLSNYFLNCQTLKNYLEFPKIEILRSCSLKKIKPDGNCYYRAIAFALEQNEEIYSDIKSQILNYIVENHPDLNDIATEEESLDQLIGSHFENGKWAEAKILSFTHFIVKKLIVVYSDQYSSPLLFPSNIDLYKEAILLKHEHDHFSLLEFHEDLFLERSSILESRSKLRKYTKPHVDQVYSNNSYKEGLDTYNDAYNLLTNFKFIPIYYQNPERKTKLSKWRYRVKRGYELGNFSDFSNSRLYFFKNDCNGNFSRYQIPFKDEIEPLIKHFHELNNQHMNQNDVQQQFEKYFITWAGITESIKNFIQQCTVCTIVKSNFYSVPTKNTPIISTAPLERLVIDELTLKFPDEEGIKIILLTCVDHFSKKGWVERVCDKSSNESALALLRILESLKPEIPKSVHTDNGLEFFGDFKRILEEKGIKHIKGRPYHPQSQGAVESFNKYITKQIKTFKIDKEVAKKPFSIAKAIQKCLDTYNNDHFHRTTKSTPNKTFTEKSEEELNKVKANTTKASLKKEKPKSA
jgi:hypothetical protein